MQNVKTINLLKMIKDNGVGPNDVGVLRKPKVKHELNILIDKSKVCLSSHYSLIISSCI